VESTNDKIIDLLKTHLGDAKFGIIIINYVKKRLKIGDKKFKREMPFGKYKIKDVREELVDALIYLLSMDDSLLKEKIITSIIELLNILELIEMEEINNANSKDQRTYLET
jgi:hypothetical protein